jgi:hypothetical protein
MEVFEKNKIERKFKSNIVLHSIETSTQTIKCQIVDKIKILLLFCFGVILLHTQSIKISVMKFKTKYIIVFIARI